MSTVNVAWYDQLRAKYKPEQVRVLLIGESPPASESDNKRFFYSSELTRYDNLYRGVAQALYKDRDKLDIRDKARMLDRMRDDGFWLIDAVQEPINRRKSSARLQAIRSGAPVLVKLCIDLAPEVGVIICHDKVYRNAADALRGSGVRVLHDRSLPFPLGNKRKEFVEGFQRAINDAEGAGS